MFEALICLCICIPITYSYNNMCQKCEAIGLNGFICKEQKNIYAENMKKNVGAVWQLPAKQHSQYGHFHTNWAELAVLFSRQLPNGSHDFFHIFSIYFVLFFRYETNETHSLAFLTHNILVLGGVPAHPLPPPLKVQLAQKMWV